jgi:deoxyribonuclease-4
MHRAFQQARDVGCDCLQVFVKNQRQWKAEPISKQDIRTWQQTKTESPIAPVIAHDSYLINLASPDELIWKKSIDAFVEELHRCRQLEIPWLVAHPGSHRGRGEDWGIQRIADALDIIHRRTNDFPVKTVLETTAGQGTALGYCFQHLAEIIDKTKNSDRLAICFDTCHVFAAGYDLTTPQDYIAVINEFEQVLGFEKLVCFHLNDSKKPLGSRVDRHEAIGQGQMGHEPFRLLVNDQHFFSIPMIIETPKGTGDKEQDLDRINLTTLRGLIKTGAKTSPQSP